MALPAGHELRPPTQDDLEPVAEVLIASELDDAGQVVLGEDFLRGEWSRSGFDPATDALVAVDALGTIVGYVQAVAEEPAVVESWGVVHPERRGQGIGSSLLDGIEQRVSDLLTGHPSGRFRHAIDAGDLAAAAMLEARGFRPARHFWHMQIDLSGVAEPGPAPEGIHIAAIDAPDDLPAVHAVLHEAFAGDLGDHPEPFDRWVEEETASPSYDPTLWLLAWELGGPVGALTASVGDDRGWVGWLGVVERCRGRGIAAALLRRSFAAFAGRDVGRVTVNVDAQNPTGATALYERVGMRVVKRWDQWERCDS